jgi:hypothetical protein
MWGFWLDLRMGGFLTPFHFYGVNLVEFEGVWLHSLNVLLETIHQNKLQCRKALNLRFLKHPTNNAYTKHPSHYKRHSHYKHQSQVNSSSFYQVEQPRSQPSYQTASGVQE